ncbi:MAG: hypothetical protein CMO44_13215 [Verrucomicrobiales bacterium]|nr:hypothetical protein [Verrucomicrobiales bacterium]|tara:strand:+ start:7537 stop:8436 length:900 start_codon:yes stop_codon:yes gene_type:complete
MKMIILLQLVVSWTAIALKRVPRALFKMSRPIVIPQSAMLTASGAIVAVDEIKFTPELATTAALVATTCATSMILNDLVDAHRGTDANRQSNQVVAGNIYKHEVVIFLTYVYIAEICVINTLESTVLKMALYLGLFATIIYTNVLKPITWIKNISVAGIIASSPIVGALSVTEVLISNNDVIHVINTANQALLIKMSAMIFFIFFFKEILMDVQDYEDDKNSGIVTVPVKYGKKNAILTSLSVLTTMIVISHDNTLLNLSSLIMILYTVLIYLDEKYIPQLFSQFKYLSAIMIASYTIS